MTASTSGAGAAPETPKPVPGLDPLNARRYRIQDIRSHPENSHARVLRLVGRDLRVLELGCATGAMTQALVEQGCRVTGVESEEIAACFAVAHAERLVVGDLDAMDLVSELGRERFDVVVAADVLEHLRDPERALSQAVALLQPGGRVVASVPNVAHGAVRLALLSGRFRYQENGLVDRTHLHFYTYGTARQLLQSCGLVVTDLERVQVPIPDAMIEVDYEALPPGMTEWVARQPEALTYQFVFGCRVDETRRPALSARLTGSAVSRTVDRDHVLETQARALAQMDATIQSLRRDLVRSRSAAAATNAQLKAYEQSRLLRLAAGLHRLEARARDRFDRAVRRRHEG